jgi:hypothetical protein
MRRSHAPQHERGAVPVVVTFPAHITEPVLRHTSPRPVLKELLHATVCRCRFRLSDGISLNRLPSREGVGQAAGVVACAVLCGDGADGETGTAAADSCGECDLLGQLSSGGSIPVSQASSLSRMNIETLA